MPPKSSQQRMAEQLAGGNLEEIVRAHQRDGLSFDAIAARLYADYRIEATGNTVNNWFGSLPVTEPVK